MALVNSLYLRGAKQKLAGAVFYQQAGRTVARELAAEVSNPRTPSQMGQRVKWANLVQFYKANKGWMKKAFEGKKATQSDYNKFMSMNVPNARIYLTKQDAAVGACIVDAFRVAEGTLPPVELKDAGGQWLTNLFVEDDLSIGDSLTIAELSASLISFNPNIKQGDQLSFIRVTQITDNQGVPRIQVRAYEFVVNPNNPALFKDFWPIELMDTYSSSEEGTRLSVMDNGNSGAFAIVVSRTTSGKTAVSSANLTLVNMAEMTFSYSKAIQLERASVSYGVSDDVFLDSDIAFPQSGEPTASSLLYVKVGTEVAVAGETPFQVGEFIDNRIIAAFNKPVQLVSGDVIRINDETGKVASIAPNVSGNNVYFDATIENLGALTSDAEVTSLEVVLGGVNYTFKFGTYRAE